MNVPSALSDIHKGYFPFNYSVPEHPKKNSCFARITAIALGALFGWVCQGWTGAFSGASLTLGATISYRLASRYIQKTLRYYPPRVLAPINDPKPGQYQWADVRVFDDAVLAHEWKKQLIDAAQESIELSACIAGGMAFQEVLSLIAKNMDLKPALRVHIMVLTSLMEREDVTMLKEMKQRFKSRFEYIATSMTVHLDPVVHTQENHTKFLIVDEKYVQLGGTNMHKRSVRETMPSWPEPTSFAETTIDPCTRDMDMAASGELLAKTVRWQFFNLYHVYESRERKTAEHRYFTLEPEKKGRCHAFHELPGVIADVRVKFICSGSEHRHMNPITKEYIKRIKQAKQRILLANLFFHPVDELKEALKHTKVPVTCVVNGSGSQSLIRMAHVLPARAHYEELADEVYEYRRVETQYHRKVGIFDPGASKSHVIIGSYNLGGKSGQFDEEAIFVCKDPRVANKVHESIQEDIASSNKWVGQQGTVGRLQGRALHKLIKNFF